MLVVTLQHYIFKVFMNVFILFCSMFFGIFASEQNNELEKVHFVHVSDVMPENCTKIPGNGVLLRKTGAKYEAMMPGRITLHHFVGNVVPTEQMATTVSFAGIPIQCSTSSNYNTKKYACIDTAKNFREELYGGSALDVATIGTHTYGTNSCFIIPENERDIFEAKNEGFRGRVIFYDSEQSNVKQEVEKYLQAVGAYILTPEPDTFDYTLFPVPYKNWAVKKEQVDTEAVKNQFVDLLSRFLRGNFCGSMHKGPLESLERVAMVLNYCYDEKGNLSIIPPPYSIFLNAVACWNAERFFGLQLRDKAKNGFKEWMHVFAKRLKTHAVGYAEILQSGTKRSTLRIYEEFRNDRFLSPWSAFVFNNLCLRQDVFFQIAEYMKNSEFSISPLDFNIMNLEFLKDMWLQRLYDDPIKLTTLPDVEKYFPVMDALWNCGDERAFNTIKEFQGDVWNYLARKMTPEIEAELIEILNSDTTVGELWKRSLRANGKVVETTENNMWSSELLVKLYCDFRRNTLGYDSFSLRNNQKKIAQVLNVRNSKNLTEAFALFKKYSILETMEGVMRMQSLFEGDFLGLNNSEDKISEEEEYKNKVEELKKNAKENPEVEEIE